MDDFEEKIRTMAEGGNTLGDSVQNEDEQDYQKIMNAAGQWRTPEGTSKEKSWSQLDQIISNTSQNKLKSNSTRRYWLAVAASISLLLMSVVAYYFLTENEVIISTEVSQIKTHYLPDGSKIILNAMSEVSYNEENFEKERSLSLTGQGYFEVREGSTFKVETGAVVTEVLGTSFSIYSRNSHVEVSCASGMIRVSNEAKEFMLSKGEKVSAIGSNMDLNKTSFDPEKAITWTKGKFYYDNEKLNLVLKEIEIQFDVEIQGSDFSNRRYSGYFDNEDLESALKQVLTPMGYSYKVEDNTVITD